MQQLSIINQHICLNVKIFIAWRVLLWTIKGPENIFSQSASYCEMESWICEYTMFSQSKGNFGHLRFFCILSLSVLWLQAERLSWKKVMLCISEHQPKCINIWIWWQLWGGYLMLLSRCHCCSNHIHTVLMKLIDWVLVLINNSDI